MPEPRSKVSLDVPYIENFLDDTQMTELREYVRHHELMINTLFHIHGRLGDLRESVDYGNCVADDILDTKKTVADVLLECIEQKALER